MPPEPLEVYLDETNDSDLIAATLRAAGITVHRHREHFEQGTDDVDWLPRVGERQWLILTKDDAIRRNHIERAALLNANAPAFVLVAKNLTGEQIATTLVQAIPAIRRMVAAQPSPFIAKIHRDSRVELWVTAHSSSA